RACAYQLLKHAVVFRPAIGVAGTVFRDRADVDGLGANGLRPAHRDAQKMSIAKRHVGHGNLASTGSRSAQLILWYRNSLIRQGRAADGTEMIQLDDEPLAHAVEIGNLLERAPLALLRSLPVA